MLELYHTINSVCAQKIRIQLEEKALPWSSRLMTLRGDQFDPDYLKLNPNAVVPTLVHDGRPVVESSVILYYLEEVFPAGALMPSDPRLRMKVRLYNKIIDEKIHNACTVLTFATALRPNFQRMEAKELDAYLSRAPDKRRSSFKRDVIASGLQSAFAIEAIEHYILLFKWLIDSLSAGDYLVGDALSLADIAVFPYIFRLEQIGLSPMWQQRDEIAAWYKRVGDRPAVLTAIAKAMTASDRAVFENGRAESWLMVASQEAFQAWASAA